MEELRNSKPVMIALIAALLAAAYFFFLKGGEEEVVPPAPPPTAATTGPTGGATGKTGATGATDKLSAAERKAAKRAALRTAQKAAAKEAGLPLDVYLARKRGDVVIIFFWEPKGKDDQRVNEAVKAVDKADQSLSEFHGHRVKVFRDRISNSSRYDGIAEAAKATQTPALIVLYKESAILNQGYIDPDTLAEKISQMIKPTSK